MNILPRQFKLNIFISQRFCFFVLVCFIFVDVSPYVVSQDDATPQLLLEVNEGLHLYELNADGTSDLFYSFPAEFSLYQRGETEWVIPSPQHIVISPTGDRIAFVATYEFIDTSLFWFDIGQTDLQQVEIPGLGFPEWSPNGQMLILHSEYMMIDQYLNLNDAYLYVFADNSLNLLPNPLNSSLRSGFRWLSNQQILYLGRSSDCDEPCIWSSDLFLLTLDLITAVKLTDIGQQIPNSIAEDVIEYYSFCLVDMDQLQVLNDLIYYVVTCFDTTDQAFSFLYSVDLDRNNQLHANVPSMYTDNFYMVIRNLQAVNDIIYFAVESQTRPQIGGLEAIFGNWRVFSMVSDQMPVLISESRFAGSAHANLFDIDWFSSQNQLIQGGRGNIDESVTNRMGYYEIINVNTGQMILQGELINEIICTVEWIDDTHVLISTDIGNCRTFGSPASIITLDILTGVQIDISDEFEGEIWLLESP